jgi:hypothetical protein
MADEARIPTVDDETSKALDTLEDAAVSAGARSGRVAELRMSRREVDRLFARGLAEAFEAGRLAGKAEVAS